MLHRPASPGPTEPAEAAPRFRRVEVVANLAAGGVGPDAVAQLEQIFAEFGSSARICAPAAGGLAGALRSAVAAGPDLLVVLGGDGTVRTAAELCGRAGPVIAPLPGGTMNMLPRAVYGARAWQDALRAALAHGEVRTLGGGVAGGHRFLVAAILGSPALWAPAREAARHGQVRLAWARAVRAIRRGLSGRLRYVLDARPRAKAATLSFLTPLISRALDEDEAALEAAILDLRGAGDVLSLGFHALIGDWREAPAVAAVRCREARVWATHRIPAIVDGESVRLDSSAKVEFQPELVRALVLPRDLRCS